MAFCFCKTNQKTLECTLSKGGLITRSGGAEGEAEEEAELHENEAAPTDPLLERTKRRLVKFAQEESDDQEIDEDQRQVLLGAFFDQDSLDLIDQKTQEMFLPYFPELLKNVDLSTGAIRERSKTLKWLEHKLPTIKRIALTAGASTALRTALHLIPGVGHAAGTITGAIIGGIGGKWRAEEKAREQGFGYNSVVSEYQMIANDQHDSDARKNALAYLETLMLSGDFKGNLADTLKILAFYSSQAHQFEELLDSEGRIDFQRNNLGHGLTRSAEFRDAVKESVSEAGIAGMKRGALVGAGIGVISDVASFALHWVQMNHFKQEYITEHLAKDHQIEVINGPDIHHVYSPYSTNELFQHIPNQPTDWGDAFATAVQRSGIQPPDAYVQAMASQGMTPDQIYGQFIHDLHFAQPLNGHNVMADNYSYYFNPEGMQHFVDNATRLDANGHLDYNYFAEQLRNADKFLSENFPSRGFDYTLHEQIPYYAGLDQDATNYAANTIGLPAMAAQSMAHGAALGTATGLALENKRVSGPGLKGTEIRGHSNGSGTNAPQAPGETHPPAPGPQAPVEEEEEPREPVVPTEPIPSWPNLLKDNFEQFKNTANAVLYNSTKKNWGDMSGDEKQNIASLISTIRDNNTSASPRRFKIFISIGTDDFLPDIPPAADTPAFSMLKNDGTTPAAALDLTTRRNTDTRPLIRMQENPLPAGRAPENDRVTPRDLSQDLHLLAPFSDNSRYKVELIRGTEERDGRRVPKKIWEEDVTSRGLEILGADTAASRLILRDSTGNIHQITTTDLVKAEEINISTW